MNRIGSRCQVMHGTAKQTSGGLTKKQLKYNKQGKIVSRKASALAKKNNRLVKAGYTTKKGEFGVEMKGGGGQTIREAYLEAIIDNDSTGNDEEFINDEYKISKITNYIDFLYRQKKHVGFLNRVLSIDLTKRGLPIPSWRQIYLCSGNNYKAVNGDLNKYDEYEYNLNSNSKLYCKIKCNNSSEHKICFYLIYHEKKELLNISIVLKENLPDIDYLNLARAARSWKNKFYKEAFDKLPELRKHSSNFIAKKNSLASIMRLLPSKAQAPNDYAPGKTTSRINDIIKGFKVKKEYSKLTPVQKAKATKLLKHNHYDVTILRILLEEIILKDPSRLAKAIYKLSDIKS